MQKLVKAKYPHECDYCHRQIKSGDLYKYSCGVVFYFDEDENRRCKSYYRIRLHTSCADEISVNETCETTTLQQ